VTVQGDNLGGIVVHQSVTEYETDKPLNYFEDNITIVTSNAAKYQNGLNIFPYNTGAQNNFLSIMTMDGKIIRTPLEDVANPSMLNDTTIFAALQGNPLFWNFITGDTEWFNLTENQHHDMSYNPTTDTFMMLERETVAVVNNTGQIENMSIDTIFEYDRDGNVKWEWHLDDHTNYSWYYEDLERINQSKVDFSRGRLDPTHANSIYWDTEEDKVYLNVRHFHQVYKIDRQTGAVDWIAGAHGNFTQYLSNGKEVESLFYSAHDATYIGNNEILLFDNGRKNTTDPEFDRSSILRFKVDTTTWEMHEVFRYQASANDYCHFWGAAQLLDNGNYLGSFGCRDHGETVNVHEDYGGAAIEVDPTGAVVWRVQLPFDWGFYRFKRVIPKLTISAPLAATIEEGGELDLAWDAYSNFPATYALSDGTTDLVSDTWDGGEVAYSVPLDLATGVTTFTVTIVDQAGNTQTASVDVTVESKEDDSNVLLMPVTISSFIAIYAIRKKKM
jgi:hypothetical protein